ncbi:hypothetical protein HY468_02750 [Candidatus Roizmanbacteria bacterium]|nr:hypothetical protein [Candidatus Roizmanbacteria bacterium]
MIHNLTLHYFKKTIYIPTVTKTGKITGSIERWEAHKKGILHKAFSIALFYEDQIYLQVRKHPVFDGIVDVTASSHPEMKEGTMEDENDAVIRCLKREWRRSVAKSQLHDIGSVYYRSKDPKSEYIEHEYCTFYSAEIEHEIKPDLAFAYGFIQVDNEYLKKNPSSFNLAAWVKTALREKLL